MPHLKILDLVISVKMLFPDKVILTGFRDLIWIFWGGDPLVRCAYWGWNAWFPGDQAVCRRHRLLSGLPGKNQHGSQVEAGCLIRASLIFFPCHVLLSLHLQVGFQR